MPITRKEFTVKEVPIEKIVVYRDQAEISRTLQFKAEIGEHEVVLKDIPTDIKSGSVRVDGRGSAIITDVNVSTSYTSQEPENDPKKKELQDIVDRIEARKKVEEQEAERLQLEKKFWDSSLESLSRDAFAVKNGQSYPFTPELVKSFHSFLATHAEEMKRIQEKIRLQETVQQQVQRDWEAAWRNLNEHTSNLYKQNSVVVVSLEATAPGPLDLTIRYVALNSSWQPKYDVRITDDQKKLTISYYALISQRTGEVWDEKPLSLSTALPSCGSSIPQLGTKQVSFKQPPPPPPQPLVHQKAFGYSMRAEPEMVACSMFSDAPRMSHRTATVSESGLSATFDITKPTTVPTDGSEHKVTVGVIELEPKVQYKSIPKKAALAFLEARAINTSPYPILAGPASVFFGSSFVATVDLKTTSPQEEFSCSLGADPAVKVTYRPVRRFNEQSGLVSKTNTVTYSQDIEIYNTRAESISIVVIDQVPLSTEEKLKVTLVEPPLTREKPEGKGYLLNDENNLEHRFDVKERSKYNFAIKYRLEYPSDKEVEETELTPVN